MEHVLVGIIYPIKWFVTTFWFWIGAGSIAVIVWNIRKRSKLSK